ncbi:hypothetical protein OM076_25770 [Solirubrobacter ginsenosidimutans]|uniref:Uncharacterized protein n=1 Tax=Solirubrobacter ginsenosidimutans TaxID=490573 RepID=A0A9X3MWG6_9ACTN|nr:hypothetical protein [Solirubrobacter ginsenosidimutans]MDA0163707.1 hypothetical protein [Solirubrobacter ginsenosidimutans]
MPRETPSAIDASRVENASTRPDGDLVMCDVSPEDASVIVSDPSAGEAGAWAIAAP